MCLAATEVMYTIKIFIGSCKQQIISKEKVAPANVF